MHLTLKKEATKPAAKNFLQQQAGFDVIGIDNLFDGGQGRKRVPQRAS